MVREDNAVVIRHEKCNLGPLQDEIRLEFDAQSKTFKRFGTVPATVLAQQLMRNTQRAAILRLVGHLVAQGQTLSLTSNNPNYAIDKVLAKEDESLARMGKRALSAMISELKYEGLIAEVEYRKAGRGTGKRVELTAAGETRVAIGSGAAPTWAQRNEGAEE